MVLSQCRVGPGPGTIYRRLGQYWAGTIFTEAKRLASVRQISFATYFISIVLVYIFYGCPLWMINPN